MNRKEKLSPQQVIECVSELLEDKTQRTTITIEKNFVHVGLWDVVIHRELKRRTIIKR
jgi:hypothetical protein